MELKIPPVIVFLTFAGLMFLVDRLLPFGEFDFLGRHYLILALLVLGAAVGIAALMRFFKSKTTVDPTKPSKASALVTSGIFAYSRNPMYLAMLLILVALGLGFGNAFNALLAAAFVAFMNRFQIIPEERALLKIFGKAYQQYCLNVRRWL